MVTSLLYWGAQNWAKGTKLGTQISNSSCLFPVLCRRTSERHPRILRNPRAWVFPMVLLWLQANSGGAPISVVFCFCDTIIPCLLLISPIHHTLTGLLVIVPALSFLVWILESALDPTIHVTDKDVEQLQSQHRSLRNATCHWSPLGHGTTDHSSSSVTIQPVPHPRIHQIKLSLQFRDKDIMRDRVRCFAQIQVDDISCCSFILSMLLSQFAK